MVLTTVCADHRACAAVRQDAGIAAKLLGLSVIDKCIDYIKVNLYMSCNMAAQHAQLHAVSLMRCACWLQIRTQ